MSLVSLHYISNFESRKVNFTLKTDLYFSFSQPKALLTIESHVIHIIMLASKNSKKRNTERLNN